MPATSTATESSSLIELHRVEMTYTASSVITKALIDIDLSIARGEYISIAGPSGSGKSSLLAILGLLDAPTAGTYTLLGQDVTALTRRQRNVVRSHHIGFIFQAFNLLPDITVAENVALPLVYRGTAKAERDQRAEKALADVGLSHRMHHWPHELSGGQQQRVAVARAICGAPSLVLADEPTGNLDSENGDHVMELIRGLHEGGATVCLVTHDQRHARHAQRVVTIFDGRVM